MGNQHDLFFLQERKGVKRILGIDPGCHESAWLIYDTERQTPIDFDKSPNEAVLDLVSAGEVDGLAIEMIASYGMPVGREVFETVLWIGEFKHAWRPRETELIYRKDVKIHLCGSMKAKDSNIMQALIDLYGGSRRAAVGVKKERGPLYGISKDIWSALAIARTAAAQQPLTHDTQQRQIA